MNRLGPSTRLSELLVANAQRPPQEGCERLARSIEQSMRVEGYPVSLSEVRLSAERLLAERNR